MAGSDQHRHVCAQLVKVSGSDFHKSRLKTSINGDGMYQVQGTPRRLTAGLRWVVDTTSVRTR
jgi:hypothetical protein